MSHKSRFRITLLCSILVGIAAEPVSWSTQFLLPDTLEDSLTAYEAEVAEEQDAAIERNELPIAELILFPFAIGLVGAFIYAVIALFRFQSHARPFAVVVTIISVISGGVATVLFETQSIDAGIGYSMELASAMLWGACLMMVWLEPYASLFRSEEPQQSN